VARQRFEQSSPGAAVDTHAKGGVVDGPGEHPGTPTVDRVRGVDVWPSPFDTVRRQVEVLHEGGSQCGRHDGAAVVVQQAGQRAFPRTQATQSVPVLSVHGHAS
jgi:hypothetical protein